jgi:hypothetical protein
VSTLIVGLLIGLGLIALITPGIILAIMYSLVVPVIINENVGALGSLSRSKRLVDHRWLKTFAFFLIIGIVVLLAAFIGTLVALPFGDFGWVVSSIISAFLGPILPISTTVYYYSMAGREEEQRIPPTATSTVLGKQEKEKKSVYSLLRVQAFPISHLRGMSWKAPSGNVLLIVMGRTPFPNSFSAMSIGLE